MKLTDASSNNAKATCTITGLYAAGAAASGAGELWVCNSSGMEEGTVLLRNVSPCTEVTTHATKAGGRHDILDDGHLGLNIYRRRERRRLEHRIGDEGDGGRRGYHDDRRE